MAAPLPSAVDPGLFGRPVRGGSFLERLSLTPKIRPATRRLVLALAVALVTAPVRAVAQDVPEQGLRPPRLVQRTEASYPPTAMAERREGTVTLEITVETSGQVSDPKVIESGGREFDEAALGAVDQWVFAPAEEVGKPVAARIRVKQL